MPIAAFMARISQVSELIKRIDSDISKQSEIYKDKELFFLYSGLKKKKLAYLAELKQLERQIAKIQKAKSIDLLDKLIDEQISSIIAKIDSIDRQLGTECNYLDYFNMARKIVEKY